MPDLRLFPNLQVIRPLGFASKALNYITVPLHCGRGTHTCAHGLGGFV